MELEAMKVKAKDKGADDTTDLDRFLAHRRSDNKFGIEDKSDTDCEDDVSFTDLVPATPMVGTGVDTDKTWNNANASGVLGKVEWASAIWKQQDLLEAEKAGAECEKDKQDTESLVES